MSKKAPRFKPTFCMSRHGCWPQVRCLGLQKSNQHQQSLKKLHLLPKSTQIGPNSPPFCKSELDQEPGAWVCEKTARGEHQHSVATANKALTIHFWVKLHSSSSESAKIRFNASATCWRELKFGKTSSAFGCHGVLLVICIKCLWTGTPCWWLSDTDVCHATSVLDVLFYICSWCAFGACSVLTVSHLRKAKSPMIIFISYIPYKPTTQNAVCAMCQRSADVRCSPAMLTRLLNIWKSQKIRGVNIKSWTAWARQMALSA